MQEDLKIKCEKLYNRLKHEISLAISDKKQFRRIYDILLEYTKVHSEVISASKNAVIITEQELINSIENKETAMQFEIVESKKDSQSLGDVEIGLIFQYEVIGSEDYFQVTDFSHDDDNSIACVRIRDGHIIHFHHSKEIATLYRFAEPVKLEVVEK